MAYKPNRPTIMSQRGMVAAAHPLAAQAGLRILDRGGNAFDAAVAVAASLNVVEPFMSGLAGMGYATMWVASEQRMRVLDYVPPVPASFPYQRFPIRTLLERGPFSVGLPAALDGWCTLHAQYGTLSLETLLEPAIALAMDGFAMSDFGATEVKAEGPGMKRHPIVGASWAALCRFADAIEVGDIVHQPELAHTFAMIAREGRDYLYNGPLGKAISTHLQSLGGFLTVEDIASVHAVWREPISTQYRSHVIHTTPPPSEAFQFLLTLRILDAVDFRELPRNEAEHLDLVTRAIRLAAGARIDIQAAHKTLAPENLESIFADDYVATLRARLLDGHPIKGATEQWGGNTPPSSNSGHTTSFSIADKDGNVICVTQTLANIFGSGVIVPGTGVSLNDILYFADFQPDSPNRLLPGMPMPMCLGPSISTFNGQPVLALGTPGGYGIPQSQAQALIQLLDYEVPIQLAIEAPRLRAWDGNQVEVEAHVPQTVIDALRVKGHDASRFGTPWSYHCGGMQAIRIRPETKLMTGAADPRRDGWVAAL